MSASRSKIFVCHVAAVSSAIFIVYVLFCAAAAFFLHIPPVPDSTIILDKDGHRIGEISMSGSLRHAPAPAEGWPPFAQKVITTLEDHRRIWHPGVDPLALGRAAANKLTGGPARGASTLEAQLLRNRLWPDAPRNGLQKIKETLLSPVVRLQFGERGVVSAWLDSVPFGNLAYGLEAASWTYFNKSSAHLTHAEIIALLVIPNNPSAFDPIRHPQAWQGRFQRTLKALENAGTISAEEHSQILAESLDFLAGRNAVTLPYVRDTIRSTNWSGTIQTTIDAGLSEKITRLALKTVTSMAWRDVTDAAVIVVDRATSKVRVLIGGVSFDTQEGQVNSVFASRQAGSTLKPFTYLLAFRDLGITPASTIIDEPIEFKTDKGYGYTPRNYSNTFSGPVTAGRALAESINVPAVKLAAQVGAGKLLAFLRDVGFSTLNQPADYYGLALTLGAGEVRLWDLVQAYGALANDGQWCPLVLRENKNTSDKNSSADISFDSLRDKNSLSPPPHNSSLNENSHTSTVDNFKNDFPFLDASASLNPHCHQIADKKFVKMIADSLSERALKIGGFPIGGTLDFLDRRVAVKTGTSRNFVDNWAIGWTDRYIVGVWVGNKDGTAMKGVSGATGAGDLFASIVRLLEPESVLDTSPSAAVLPPSTSSFLAITSPLPESLYTFNPSVPASRAKIGLRFSSNITYTRAEWLVDGKPVPEALWPLEIGTHTASLILWDQNEKAGETSSRFEVIRESEK